MSITRTVWLFRRKKSLNQLIFEAISFSIVDQAAFCEPGHRQGPPASYLRLQPLPQAITTCFARRSSSTSQPCFRGLMMLNRTGSLQSGVTGWLTR
jgi:hypothetical protein